MTNMSESKVFMFPEQSSTGNFASILAPLLQQRGVDPNVLLAMNRNNGCFGDGGWFIWVIFLFFLIGWGRNGWQNGGGDNGNGVLPLTNFINNDAGRDLLMSAIQGNGSAINSLATTLNCSVDSIQNAITSVMSQIQNVGSQVGMSSQQIINSIQAGNAQIASQLASCCCENRLAICQQTNQLQTAINNVSSGQERGFSAIAYETQKQTCDIQSSLRDATDKIIEGQKNAEIREMQNKIDALHETITQKDSVITTGQQTAVFSQMIQQATGPIAVALNNLQNDVNGMKCKLPDTTTIAYSPVVGVPASIAAQYGLGPYPAGFWN